MIRKRRGIFLVEMLTVLFMVGIGGTLMTVGLASLLRSQDRVAAFGNQVTQTNDFLGTLKRDMRMATTASLREEEGGDLQQVLVIGEPPAQISYRFAKHHVERTGGATDNNAAKWWSPMTVTISLVSDNDPTKGSGINATIFLQRTKAKDPEPERRFDLFVRCAGELSDE